MNITKTSRHGITLIWDDYDLDECVKAVCSVNGHGQTEEQIKGNIFTTILTHIDGVKDPEYLGTGGWYVIFCKVEGKENTYKCKMVVMSYVVNEYVKAQKKNTGELENHINNLDELVSDLQSKLDQKSEVSNTEEDLRNQIKLAGDTIKLLDDVIVSKNSTIHDLQNRLEDAEDSNKYLAKRLKKQNAETLNVNVNVKVTFYE